MFFMKKILSVLVLSALLFSSCAGTQEENVSSSETAGAVEVLPISGTFINLAYQDVRNKYTNPPFMDNTDPGMWAAKVAELKAMGMEYLVFMAVANEGLAYYPSKMMPWVYPQWRQSPVDAIMNAAAEHGMKVFMSTGWAKDQDDNLRDPKIKQRQIDIMTELAGMYGNHPALHGWYLPVEDCFGPVLTDYAVEAVNALTARARELTPGKQILISPYGIFNSDFEDPRYEQQIARLTVDIIAYQDEIGCVRETYPLPRLKENWKKLREIHDRCGIQMWANCESFAWEKGTNDRSSALIPAPYGRLLSQQIAASAAGVDKIISFMMCGIYENPLSPYQLGQPHWSGVAYQDYMGWLEGEREWQLAQAAFQDGIRSGISWLAWNPMDFGQGRSVIIRDGKTAEENPSDKRWAPYSKGTHEIFMDLSGQKDVREVFVRMLNCHKDGIVPPVKFYLFSSVDGQWWDLVQIKDSPVFPNTNHDAFVDHVLFDGFPEGFAPSHLKLVFTADSKVCIDEIYVNPIEK